MAKNTKQATKKKKAAKAVSSSEKQIQDELLKIALSTVQQQKEEREKELVEREKFRRSLTF